MDKELDTLIGRIRELREDEDEYERATDYAINEAIAFLTTLYPLVRTRPFPKGAPCSNLQGVTVYWMREGRSLELNIGSAPDDPSYFYHREGKVSKLMYEFTPADVAQWIDRLYVRSLVGLDG